jgi:hypothetical protein
MTRIEVPSEIHFVEIGKDGLKILETTMQMSSTLKALREISLDAIKHGFAMIDSRVHIQQAADMLKKKLSGTLKMKKGRHPKMDYLE